jgi:hypothetical protein
MASFHLHDIQRKTGKFIRKFGTHDDIDSGTGINEAVWSYADVAGDYVFPSDAGEVMYISSSSTLDTMPITVQGLDADFKEKQQTVTLQGQTRITLDGTWSRINRVFNDDTNDIAGNVYVYTNGANTDGEPDTPSTVKAIIENGHNQTLQAIYTVPINNLFHLSAYHLSCDAKAPNTTANLTLKLCVRRKGSVFRTQEIIALSNSCPSVIKLDMPLPIEGGSDVLFQVISATNNNMHVHCVFEGMLL